MPATTYTSAQPLGPLSHGPSTFSVPARHNPRLQTLVERINADEELRQWWRSANLMAVERLGLSDHGETHIRIVANASLRLLRLLMESGLTTATANQPGLGREEAEVVVVLAAALHDIGLAIHYDQHQDFGLPLALDKARQLLANLYPVRERTILLAETLHAIVTHHTGRRCLTLEASVLRVADALDMTKGRSRTPADRALTVGIEEVTLQRGERCPVRIQIRMTQATGVGYAETILRERLHETLLSGQVEAVASIDMPDTVQLIALNLDSLGD